MWFLSLGRGQQVWASMSVNGCHEQKACLIIDIFYIPPLRNALPVNANDSMMVRQYKSRRGRCG